MALPPDNDAGSPDLTSPVRFGPFLLTRRLAVGGSSDVFLAQPPAGQAPAPQLVVKRLRAVRRVDPENLGAFAREAQLHRLVNHPHVVHVYEAGEVDGEPYLAMQCVDGSDAHRLLRRLHREGLALPWPIVSYIGRALAIALAAVHDATDEEGTPLHILHRDVTPSNVYLSRDGYVLLGDFGIARKVTGRTSRPDETSAIKGKYGYTKLVAVTKTHPVADIEALYRQGQRRFGENRPKEMAEKHPLLPGDVEWHFIGHLQSSNVKYIAPFVNMIHSVESLSLLQEINRQAAKHDRVIPCLLHFKIAQEESKYGLDMPGAQALLSLDAFRQMANIQIAGVMGMATFTEDEDQVRKEFAS